MRLAILFLLCVTAGQSLATNQFGDKLSVTGETITVYGFTLRKDMGELFAKNHPKVLCSANWDGWYAELSLRDGKLYLTGLDMDRPGFIWPFNGPSIRKAFGVSIPRDGLHAAWFSGDLREYFGELYGDAYLRVRVRSFKDGVLQTTTEDDSEFAKWLRKEKEADSEGKTGGQPGVGR